VINIFIKNILRFLGFDRAVSFGILARVWSLFAGPITIMIIATGFSPEQQGFYYTFSSLLALQVFFDLGLMFVIAQFASHEFVNLRWGPQGCIEGESVALKRFTDLLCKTLLWFGVASLLMIVFLVPAGLIFFGQKGAVSFSWRLPWFLAVAGTALNLFVMPFFAVIMGSGDVVTVNKRELAGAILSSVLCWLVIGLHGGLYSVFAVNLGNLVIAWGYLLYKRSELVKRAWVGRFGKDRAARKEPGLSWWGEIWPMQWRMAVSSGAAYFIFQLFNPILFHYHGAVVAGQMGMTISVANALLAGSMTVLNAKTPDFGKRIAVRDWRGLDSIFKKATLQSFGLTVAGATVGVGVIWVLQAYFPVGRRFLPPEQAAFLFATICFQTVNSAFAVYLRSHKQEPLTTMTVLASILQGGVTWYLGKQYASLGVTSGYFLVTAGFIFPYVFFIWKQCRNEWHVS
jgi:O-antigen/teichoic acid export membrane protein